MTATTTTPRDLMDRFAELASRGDLDALIDLYEPDAILQPEFGVVLRGHAEIRPASAEFLAMQPRISYTSEPDVSITGDIALVSNFWTMAATAPDGADIHESGTSADVLRRQADGSWRILIDQPRGTPTS